MKYGIATFVNRVSLWKCHGRLVHNQTLSSDHLQLPELLHSNIFFIIYLNNILFELQSCKKSIMIWIPRLTRQVFAIAQIFKFVVLGFEISKHHILFKVVVLKNNYSKVINPHVRKRRRIINSLILSLLKTFLVSDLDGSLN